MSTDMVGIEPALHHGAFCQVVLGEEYDRLYAKYGEEERDIEEVSRDQIFHFAERILGQCPNPRAKPWSRTGLANGKVQSGKTMSYIALTALAFDSGYRIVIVLSGRTEALALQNKGRFDEDLTGNRPTPKIATFHNPGLHDQGEIQTVLENDGLVLITLLKHQNRISTLETILSTPELRKYPVLIIDDEGDQASHNTKRYQGGESTVYARIRSLRHSLPHHAFVAYTATPQANLLADTIDDLAPQFSVLVEPGEGYTGGSIFFGPDRGRYIRIVPDDEAELDDVQGVPDCLRLAIATFLVSAAILHLRKPHAFHSMLIHHSNRREDHRRMQEAVQLLIDNWKEALRLPDGDPGTDEVLGFARDAYKDFQATVENCPDWDTISTKLRQEIRALKVWLVNSLPQGSNPTTAPFNLQNNIMIGGNMLDRGVTVRRLAVTYITRRAENSQADTIEQRARWFGYKESYLDLCRIFTSRTIAEIYTALLSHEDDFWDSLRQLEADGLPITAWPRVLRLDMGLRPTRASVARVRTLQTADWMVQGRPPLDPMVAAANVSVARCFFKMSAEARPHQFEGATHTLIPDCPLEEVIDLLEQFQGANVKDWDGQYLIEYLRRLEQQRDDNRTVDVLLMSQGQPRERTAHGGRINPMEGRRARYPGDYNIADGRMQLQLHIVKIRTTRDAPLSNETAALALYIPPSEEYDLGRFVVPSD